MVKLLRYGNTNTFFISGGILVDTDWAGTLPAFFKEIKRQGIDISDIRYVLATHYHPDHMGLVSELMQLGVKLLVVDVQVGHVHFSDKIFGRDEQLRYTPVDISQASVISCGGSRSFLASLGIDGEIIHTPAHSEDSISVLLDEGVAIVGDLPPYDIAEGYHDECLGKCWEQVLSHEPETVFYSHANERHFG